MNTELGIKRNDGFISLPAKEAAAGVTSRHRRSPQKGLGVHRAMQDLAGLDRHPVPAEGGPLSPVFRMVPGSRSRREEKGHFKITPVGILIVVPRCAFKRFLE